MQQDMTNEADPLGRVSPAASVPVKPARPRWGRRWLDDRVAYYWESPGVRVWYKRKGSTLAVAHCYREAASDDGEPEAPPSVLPDDLTWTRLVLGKPPSSLILQPIFPERPILFGLQTPVTIRAGASTSVFIEAPAMVRFTDPAHEDSSLVEVPACPLEKAWFGPSPGEGQICWWRKEEAVLRPEDARDDAGSITCPVTIRNDSDRDLALKTLLLQGSYLTVYATGELLWSDETVVIYGGETRVNRITVAGKPPAAVADAVRVGRPRLSSGLMHTALQNTWDFFTKLRI